MTVGDDRVRRPRPRRRSTPARRAARVRASMSRRVSRAVPTSACHCPARAQQHPRIVGAGQLRAAAAATTSRIVSRSSDRPSAWPNVHEALHLGRARAGLQGVGLRRRGVRLGFLPLALLMEEEDDRQDDEGRHQRQAGAPLDVAGQIQQVADRPGKHDDQSDREAAEQHPVLPRDQIHGTCRTVAQSAGHGKMKSTWVENPPPSRRTRRPRPGHRRPPSRDDPRPHCSPPASSLVLAIAGLVAYTRSSQPAPAAEVAQAAAAGGRRSAGGRQARTASAGDASAAAVSGLRAAAAAWRRCAPSTASRPSIRKSSATCRASAAASAAGTTRQRRLLREGAQRAGRRHRVGTARPGVRRLPRRRERSDADVRDRAPASATSARRSKRNGTGRASGHTPTPMPHSGSLGDWELGAGSWG